MTDVLIRGVSDEVLAGIDARACKLGLTRTEYLRRRMAQDATAVGSGLTVNDLREFAESFADLADEDVVAAAWR